MNDVRQQVGQAIRQYNDGQVDLAESLCRDALNKNSRAPYAHFLLGRIAHDRGDLFEALDRVERASALRSDDPAIWLLLGRILVDLQRRDEAVRALERAITLAPDDVSLLDAFMTQLMWLGRYEDALHAAQRITRLEPGAVWARASEAMCLVRLDREEEAMALLRPDLDDQPLNERVVLAYHEAMKRLNREIESLPLLERCAAQPGLSEKQHEMLLFAIADAYYRKGDVDRAFSMYRRANELVESIWQPEAFDTYVESMLTAYSAEQLPTLPRSEHLTDLPVFIVGMPRSGTSLLEQILSCHSRIHAGGERMDIQNIIGALDAERSDGLRFPEGVRHITRDQLTAQAREYERKLRRLAPNAARFTDKLPDNARFCGFIQQMLPNARIIHCMRDPLDTCFSCYTKDFGNMHAYAKDLAHLGRYCAAHMKLMAHWKDVLTLPILELHYESMVDDLERQVRRVLDFLGLEYDPKCLRFYESTRPMQTASYDQVRQPIFRSAIGRHRPFAARLAPLRRALEAQGIDLPR